MIPVAFDYVRPESVDAAVALLGERGEDGSMLAGGHSLLPLMKLRRARAADRHRAARGPPAPRPAPRPRRRGLAVAATGPRMPRRPCPALSFLYTSQGPAAWMAGAPRAVR